jgi:hypothetical protein
MSNNELIAKARAQVDFLLRDPHKNIGIEPERFSETEVLETPFAMVCFSCKDRDDIFKVVLNTESGECVLAIQAKKMPDRQSCGLH